MSAVFLLRSAGPFTQENPRPRGLLAWCLPQTKAPSLLFKRRNLGFKFQKRNQVFTHLCRCSRVDWIEILRYFSYVFLSVPHVMLLKCGFVDTCFEAPLLAEYGRHTVINNPVIWKTTTQFLLSHYFDVSIYVRVSQYCTKWHFIKFTVNIFYCYTRFQDSNAFF